MKQTVAAYIAKTLEQAGVKRIWGVTGDSLNGLSDSLNRMGTIDWMPTRHEEVAAFAAGAEAQLTGELAVCAGSCGPGNLHLINGLFDCHRNHVPVLAIAGSLAAKKRLAVGEGTLPTHGPLFVTLLIGVVLLCGLLNYVPALALGPVVEHLMLIAAH